MAKAVSLGFVAKIGQSCGNGLQMVKSAQIHEQSTEFSEECLDGLNRQVRIRAGRATQRI
ncbi:hypothetical protein [Candidatus Rhodobacter oscarellae]|uniref:hypothetical protein n=1 Tax=Candidatus Rhodobacter oscarellae TaxID=1675527 RepID=UPI001F18C867|nr:hypothetical protein [Candidatus Rhodobacter lobularis]